MVLSNAQIDALNALWLNPDVPSAFTGPQTLFTAAKESGLDISLSMVKKYLASKRGYVMHRDVRKTATVYVIPSVFGWFHCDLMEVGRQKQANYGVSYVLFLIEILSKQLYVYKLKNKLGSTVASALDDILTNKLMLNKKVGLVSDYGAEFLSREVQAVLKRHKMVFRPILSSTGAFFSERIIFTIRARLRRAMTQNRTKRFYYLIEKLAKAYNNSIHRIIKFRPAHVKLSDKSELQANIREAYQGTLQTPSHRAIPIGAQVKLAISRKLLKKKDDFRWSVDTFTIVKRERLQTKFMYTIENTDTGQLKSQKYFAWQLQLIISPLS